MLGSLEESYYLGCYIRSPIFGNSIWALLVCLQIRALADFGEVPLLTKRRSAMFELSL